MLHTTWKIIAYIKQHTKTYHSMQQLTTTYKTRIILLIQIINTLHAIHKTKYSQEITIMSTVGI